MRRYGAVQGQTQCPLPASPPFPTLFHRLFHPFLCLVFPFPRVHAKSHLHWFILLPLLGKEPNLTSLSTSTYYSGAKWLHRDTCERGCTAATDSSTSHFTQSVQPVASAGQKNLKIVQMGNLNTGACAARVLPVKINWHCTDVLTY